MSNTEENVKYLEPVKPEELFKELPPIVKNPNSKSLEEVLLKLSKSLNKREEFRSRDPKLADKLKKTAELKRLWREAKKKNDPNTQELYEMYKRYKEI